jgi:septal ring factor EnvC (AmiA/AmiB activator)
LTTGSAAISIRGGSAVRLAGFAFALSLMLLPGQVRAEGLAPKGEAPPPGAAAQADTAARKRDRENELSALESAMSVSAERQKALKAEIDALDKDRATLTETLIATGERITRLEAAVATADDRLARARESAAAIRLSLDERRDVLSEVIAALQRIGRRPPPALLVEPADARKALRSALLLGAVLPEIRVEADALAADLAALVRLEHEIESERTARASDLAALGEERARIELLVEEKRRLGAASAEKLAAERRAAEALAAKASDLKGLIAGIERDIASARDAAEAARRAAEPGAAPGAGPERLSPAIAFAEAKGRLPMPVAGRVARRFGDGDGDGGKAQGTTIAVAPGAQVTAPADGWVVYAGPFRSYGQILILNMGDGYHILLAGMERIDVDLGQFVLAGEPVGSMGGRRLTGADAVVAGGMDAGSGSAGGASLYVEFRKDGSSIDSAPWWAVREDEEVRG